MNDWQNPFLIDNDRIEFFDQEIIPYKLLMPGLKIFLFQIIICMVIWGMRMKLVSKVIQIK
jgi:hypothetical protein